MAPEQTITVDVALTDLSGTSATNALVTQQNFTVAMGLSGPQGPKGDTGDAINRTIASVSTATAAGSTAETDYVYLVSGTTTLTLPTAVSNNNLYTVKNTGSNTVSIATTSAQTIDGSSSISLPVANTSLDIVSDNANWRIV